MIELNLLKLCLHFLRKRMSDSVLRHSYLLKKFILYNCKNRMHFVLRQLPSGKECCCENSLGMSENKQLVPAPNDTAAVVWEALAWRISVGLSDNI